MTWVALGAAAIGAGGAIGGSLLSSGGGSGGTEIMSPGDQYKSLFNAWQKSLPKYLDSTKQYEPQFLGQQVKMQEDYAPAMATATRNANIAGNPELFSALSGLSNALTSRGDLTSLNMSPELINQLQDDLGIQQLRRGVTLSPASALQTAKSTLNARIAERDKWVNLAQSLASGFPSVSSGQMTSNRFADMAPPQISNMSSLQNQANTMAFSQWEAQKKAQGAGLQGLGTMMSGGNLSNLFSSGGNTGANSLSSVIPSGNQYQDVFNMSNTLGLWK